MCSTPFLLSFPNVTFEVRASFPCCSSLKMRTSLTRKIVEEGFHCTNPVLLLVRGRERMCVFACLCVCVRIVCVCVCVCVCDTCGQEVSVNCKACEECGTTVSVH